jgi:DNA-binding FadR family transcriptional regulator
MASRTTNSLIHDPSSRYVTNEEEAIPQTLRARRVLESAVTEEALRCATDADFDEIQRTVELLLSDGITPAELLRADMMFHQAVGRALHNQVLEQSLRTVYKHLVRFWELRQRSEAAVVHEIHQRQLLAMRARDPGELARALDQHFRYLEEQFAEASSRRCPARAASRHYQRSARSGRMCGSTVGADPSLGLTANGTNDIRTGR